MLFTHEVLLREFKEQLKQAARVDLAVAWATEGGALAALEEAARRRPRPCRVRALVGLQHNVTTPDALRLLRDIGELRVVDGSRLFHPKVYLFRGIEGKADAAWVGSANFTGKGFGANEEVVLATKQRSQVKEIAIWFKRKWKCVGALDDRIIDTYADGWCAPHGGQLDERSPGSVDAVRQRDDGLGDTWADDLVRAFRTLGDGERKKSELTAEVKRIREVAGRSVGRAVNDTVQDALNRHCRDAAKFKQRAEQGFPPDERFIKVKQGVYKLHADYRTELEAALR